MSSTDVSPAELVARYDGDVVRYTDRKAIPPARWESGHTGEAGWGVGALVESAEGVLLVHENDQWLLPGGMLEPGERHAAGAVREVKEETGIAVEIVTLLAVTERTFVNAADGREFDFRFATFRATPETTVVSEEPGLPGEGIERAAWHESLPANTFDSELVSKLLDRR